MKLRKVHIREYKSIWDSNSFEIDRVACLVGKNEAGKTAILQALYRLNPIVPDEGAFDVTDDYPRSDVENYQQEVENGSRKHAVVVEGTFELESAELDAISEKYGEGILKTTEIVVSKGYPSEKSGKCPLSVNVPVNEPVLVKNLVESFGLPEGIGAEAIKSATLSILNKYLMESGQKHSEAVTKAQAAAKELQDEAERAAAVEKSKTLAESEQAKTLRARLSEFLKNDNFGIYIWDSILKATFPKFLYFDEYYQMRGHDNVEALKKRKAENKLLASGPPFTWSH